jgi:hypothetical protein
VQGVVGDKLLHAGLVEEIVDALTGSAVDEGSGRRGHREAGVQERRCLCAEGLCREQNVTTLAGVPIMSPDGPPAGITRHATGRDSGG